MSLQPQDFAYIRALVKARSAIALDDDKAYLAENRLGSLARQNGFASLDDLVQQLRSGPENGLHFKVVEAMTTNETSFFRDGHPFEAIRRALLPALLRRRAADRTLTFWCAACATGQEAYSLAILLREHFPELGG